MAEYINFGKFKTITKEDGSSFQVLELHASEKTLGELKKLGKLLQSKVNSERPNVSLYLNEHSDDYRDKFLSKLPENIDEIGGFSAKISD